MELKVYYRVRKYPHCFSLSDVRLTHCTAPHSVWFIENLIAVFPPSTGWPPQFCNVHRFLSSSSFSPKHYTSLWTNKILSIPSDLWPLYDNSLSPLSLDLISPSFPWSYFPYSHHSDSYYLCWAFFRYSFFHCVHSIIKRICQLYDIYHLECILYFLISYYSLALFFFYGTINLSFSMRFECPKNIYVFGGHCPCFCLVARNGPY